MTFSERSVLSCCRGSQTDWGVSEPQTQSPNRTRFMAPTDSEILGLGRTQHTAKESLSWERSAVRGLRGVDIYKPHPPADHPVPAIKACTHSQTPRNSILLERPVEVMNGAACAPECLRRLPGHVTPIKLAACNFRTGSTYLCPLNNIFAGLLTIAAGYPKQGQTIFVNRESL